MCLRGNRVLADPTFAAWGGELVSGSSTGPALHTGGRAMCLHAMAGTGMAKVAEMTA